MNTEKVLNILLWVLLGVSAILVVSLMANLGDDADPTMGAWINTNLTWSYILLGASAIVAVVFALFHTFTDKAAAKKGLVALVFAGVVILLAYIIASDAIPQFHGVEKFELTTNASKWIGTTLNATYILLFLAIAAIVVAPVMRIFNK